MKMDLSNEIVNHVKKDGIEYLQFRILLEYGIINCFTTKINNFNLDGRIDKTITDYNYERICKSLEIPRNSILRPNQSHLDKIERVEKLVDYKYQDTDGLITDKRGIALTLSFADCTPILLYDPINKAIGNIHSGWRGTAQRIGAKAVEKMHKEFGSKPENLIVCLGPCIRECHFEVQEDVKSIYEKEFGYLCNSYNIIRKEEGREGKYLIDTTLVNKIILTEVGIKKDNIYDSNICTVCNSDVIHSFRADKDKSGRNVAIMYIK